MKVATDHGDDEFSNAEVNRIYKCYEQFLEDNSIQKYLTLHLHLPFKIRAKPIKNMSIYIPRVTAWQVFIIQYCGDDDEVAKECKIKAEHVLPDIDGETFETISENYPNNFTIQEEWMDVIKKYDKDLDKIVRIFNNRSIGNDDRKIIKHKPLPEREARAEGEDDETSQNKSQNESKGEPKHELKPGLEKCFAEFLNDTSLHKYLIKIYHLPAKDNLIPNKRIFISKSLALMVFNIQFIKVDDEHVNESADEKAKEYKIKRKPTIPFIVSDPDFEELLSKHATTFCKDTTWNKVEADCYNDPEALEKVIVTKSVDKTPKNNSPENIPLYKSIDLEPFRKMKVAEAHKAYAKALGIRPISISIKLFQRLMNGEDVDPIRNHNAKPIIEKPQLNISEPLVTRTSDEITHKPKLHLSASAIATTPEELSKPSLHVSETVTTSVPKNRKEWAKGVIEGVEIDGRVTQKEASIYLPAVHKLDYSEMPPLPDTGKVRAGKAVQLNAGQVMRKKRLKPW